MSRLEKPLTYLACPYTHPDPGVRRQRAEAANKLAGQLLLKGRLIYSPISHSHAITEGGLPVDWMFWKELSLRMVGCCQELLVLCIDGWERSVGVQAEIAEAGRLGIPVVHFHPPKWT